MDKQLQISSSLEDYLETIAELTDNGGHAHAKEIAKYLNVPSPSVTLALQSLKTRGLVNYQHHQPVTLTAEGAIQADEIRHRHAVMRSFFTEILHIPNEEANAAACKVEHVIGEPELSRLIALYKAITERDDCANLREHLAQTMPSIQPISDDDIISLDNLPKGESGIVVKVAPSLHGVQKFADLGIVPTTVVTMEGKAPFGSLLRVKVMDSSLSIRKSDAAHIWIKVIS